MKNEYGNTGYRNTHYRKMAYGKLLLTACLLCVSTVFAQSAEERGFEIATEADNRSNGFGDTTSDMKMVLRNRSGKESIRRMRSRTLEVPGDGDKSMTIFDEPRDVKGTASLTYSHATKPDEQWLYLPALKRVKRISSKNKSGPFMGSEFAFEDISSQELDKYEYKYLRDDELNGNKVFVIEAYPQYKNSGYKRLISWIDSTEYYTHKTEFYDRKDSLLKVLEFKDYQQYLDQFWRAHTMHMENRQSGKSTTLTWDNYQFQTGLGAADFNSKTLKRLK